MTARGFQTIWLLTVASAPVACRDSVAPHAPPTVAEIVVAAEPDNVLSATVRFTARNTDSARVVWDDGAGDRGSTPFIDARSGTVRTVVLGLLASHRYTLAIEARGASAIVSDAVDLIT